MTPEDQRRIEEEERYRRGNRLDKVWEFRSCATRLRFQQQPVQPKKKDVTTCAGRIIEKCGWEELTKLTKPPFVSFVSPYGQEFSIIWVVLRPGITEG